MRLPSPAWGHLLLAIRDKIGRTAASAEVVELADTPS